MLQFVGAGRYAPSPSGPLHFGNLRTAFVAWAMARTTGRRFILRIEDIDPQRTGAALGQIADLARLGLDWDGPIIYQSQRLQAYAAVLDDLEKKNLLFECYCSRREVRQAASAPHVPPGHYPGTCRNLPSAVRDRRREELRSQGRSPALRLAPPTETWTVQDDICGTVQGPVDALVLRRNDGGPAYNLAAVVDDSQSGVDQVVRGDDLLWAAPGQAYLTTLLGGPPPTYCHVPLVLNQQGDRLAKRDGAVTLDDLLGSGMTVGDVVSNISRSLSIDSVTNSAEFLEAFTVAKIPREPYYFRAE